MPPHATGPAHTPVQTGGAATSHGSRFRTPASLTPGKPGVLSEPQYPFCEMGRRSSALSASWQYCEARRRYVPMEALRETYHAIHILRTVGLSKLPEEHVPSTKEPSLPRLHPLTPRFLSSHIPEFREIVRHPNLKKASTLIPQLQEDDREGSHVTVFSPGLAMLQLSRYKSNYREANKKRKDGGSNQP